MRFLVDRCAGARLAEWLREQGHDVSEAAGQGDDPGDAQILRRAVDEDRILVTIDTDFGLLIFADLLARHSADLEARAIVTVRAGVVRISRLPPSGPGESRDS